MPIHDSRPLRRPRRIAALITICLSIATASLAAPSTASAYEESFCVFAWLGSGWDCYASNRHTLQAVRGISSGYQRICAASFSAPWGSQNSNWRCDYGEVTKYLDGRVAGVGAIHNGDPYPMYIVGYQYF